MRLVMLKRDVNLWFKKNDVVELKEFNNASQIVLVYNKKNKKQMWLMYKDVL